MLRISVYPQQLRKTPTVYQTTDESILSLFQGHSLSGGSLKHWYIEASCMLSIAFQNTVLTAQKLLMVDEKPIRDTITPT